MTPEQRGHLHGEEYSKSIIELSEIRRDLMLSKSPHLAENLKELSKAQYDYTAKIFPEQFQELEAIRLSSGASIEEIVILNNYTDFRDIQLPEEGCTTVGLKRDDYTSGQTWDMHSSAKNYVCTMGVQGKWQAFSLVGCLGMMGANSKSIFVGVNNINTKNAAPGVIWPALIRALIKSESLKGLRSTLLGTKVTSGHNYLISDGSEWENWEIGATFQRLSDKIDSSLGLIYHTNHCLDPEAKEQELPLALNSTSLNRLELITKKAENLKTKADIIEVLQDHDGFPKSICSHFQSSATDPSTTCGGAVFDHRNKKFLLWRCCPRDKERYIERELQL